MLLQPLVFAHANGFTGASYRTLLAPLGERFELHPLERLAHHPDFPVDRNWHSLCDEYLDAVRAVGRPVIAVGHSMGGVLSIMGACRAPEHFRAVIALDPPLLIGRDAWMLKLAKLTGVIDRITPAGKTLKRREHWPSREAMHHSLRQRTLFKGFTEAALADYVSGATRLDEQGAARLLFAPRHEAAVFRHLPDHLSGVLKRLEVPLTVIAGETSTLLTAARRRQLARAGVTLGCVPGGHMFPFEHPEATRTALLAALDRMREGQHVVER
ncbi:alpha/beta hydrolase [Salinicola endophyticus]|uniref:Alpha/beta hydrolase n=1 Tax=Salinicola endophyticus TaxID=1949083 RepID=A0ABY8FIA4_9GAMM|nr:MULTISPECIES: alpha/beta hydrolase [Salinicola]WFF42553.1 alpha/beta hydrolase [Salinicola endophyticus]